jgi:hypothetical protein
VEKKKKTNEWRVRSVIILVHTRYSRICLHLIAYQTRTRARKGEVRVAHIETPAL